MISGMPRSGSTLFTAILNQNPRFNSEPTTLLYFMFEDMFFKINKSKHGLMIGNEKRTNILLGLFDAYYKDVPNEVCFNTNRAWASMRHVIAALNSNMKIICFVREVPLILNSFEKAFLKHPLYMSSMYDLDNAMHSLAADRCEHLFKNKLVPQIKIIEEIKNSQINQDNILFIEYEHLCENPERVLQNFYEFINEPYFQHDFNNVETNFEVLDTIDNNPELHKTEKQIRSQKPQIVVPTEILDKYNIGKYWLK